MGVTIRDIPSELKSFWKLFEKLAYRWDYSHIFNDYIDMAINFFKDVEVIDNSFLNKYSAEEKEIFNSMFREMVATYDRMITNDTAWYDFFGNLYMIIASNGKQSAFGQFFTPVTIVEAIIVMQSFGDLRGKGVKVSDPACGSGRFLLAFHAKNPGNYCFAEDLDPICAKMSAINMMFHGCEGEVVCHDSIMLGSWNFGYKINPHLRITGLPSIGILSKEESFIMKIGMNRDNPKPVNVPSIKQILPQLSLFEEVA